jgi:hypothetical protein
VKSKNIFVWGGVVASAILILFGISAIALGFQGRDQVRDSLAREKIVGTPDMTPAIIAASVEKAGLANVDLPSCTVAGKAVDTGKRAQCFADYMRIHALEATGGLTYAQMPHYIGTDGKPTDDVKKAAIDPKSKQPVTNAARNTWVTEVSLSNALNTSYFAENVANFGIITGIALLLTGIGFLVLTFGTLHRAGKDNTA